MKILFLTQILPYPPDAGPRIKTWNVLRYLLSQGHQISLVSFIRKTEEPYIPTVQSQGIELHTVPMRRSRIKDGMYWLRSHFSGLPFLVERDNIPEMHQLVNQLLQQPSFDAVHADQLTMAQFVPYHGNHTNGKKKWLTVFDAHNATYSILERSHKTSPWYLRPVIRLEANRVKKYEVTLAKKFDITFTVTAQDRHLFASACSTPVERQLVEEKITVIPIAVDASEIQPVQRTPGSHNIVTLGTLSYPPNADGIRWFIQEIFPKIKNTIQDATLTVIGKNPPPDFYSLSDHSGGSIRITGYVNELTTWLSQAALMVVPVRAGSGMRVRILEAFARGMPVVTTTIGLEGIDARVGEDVLVSDQADDFSGEVVRLLENPALQASLASNGRTLVEKKYDWRIVLEKLDNIYAAD